ncbi:MAG: AMP-binding protein, partial [bacterium]|nr:AMP-binding protein [bacterium]
KVLDVIGRNNAKHRLINGYGPTETTVYSTYYFINGLKENVVNVPIGGPVPNTTVYIADKNKNLTPPGVAGELFIGGTSLAHGYLNRPELTAEKFTEPGSTWEDITPRGGDYPTPRGGDYPTPRGGAYPAPRDGVYRTGDLVRWLPDGNIQYLGRIDQQVKIRGFRIEPGEIRGALLKHPAVGDAVVRAMKYESGDTFLCAYVVSQSKKTAHIKDFLSDSLPDYMVPDHFVYLDAIPLTVNGKVDNKALPAPTADTSPGGDRQRQTAYSAPRNARETGIRATWAEVLKTTEETIGIDDNFFLMGGHSLNAGILLAKLHKKLEIKISMGDFFKTPTIRGLHNCIGKTSRTHHIAVVPTEEREYYPLSSAQKRLYFLHKLQDAGTGYNISMAYTFSGHMDEERYKNAFKALALRHDSLRTSFLEPAGEPKQAIAKDADIAIDYFTLADGRTVNDSIRSFIRPFDLSKAPLLRIGTVALSENEYVMIFDMHHIVSDGTSMELLAGDFNRLYAGETLPPLQLQYKDFTLWQKGLQESGALDKQKSYWLEMYPKGDEIPVLDVVTDFPRPPVFSFEGDRCSFQPIPKIVSGIRSLT